MVVTVISAPFTMIFPFIRFRLHSDLIVGQFFEKPLTPFQHIPPSGLEIACVPRVGNIARAVGVVRSLRSSPCTIGVLCYRRACPITQHCVPYGICASAACTNPFSEKRSANFAIYFRFLTE